MKNRIERMLLPFSHKNAKKQGIDPDFPDLTDGFDRSLEAPGEGIPLISFCTEPLPAGTYALHVTLKAIRETGVVYLFAGRKQMHDRIALREGEIYDRTFYLSVAEIIPRYHSHPYFVERVFFSVAASHPKDIVLCFGSVIPVDIPTVFLGGDSTVTDQPAELPYHPGSCYASWGQNLPYFIDQAAAVENQARSGLTTETFRREGHYGNILHHMHSGDFCLFQFGHNDQKLIHLQADKDYQKNLIRYVEEVKATDATPVLVTPLGRNIWNDDGTYNDLLKEHADAVIRVAQKEDVEVIDLHRWSVEFIREHGLNASRGYYHPGDYTHTNDYGAYLFASYIAMRLKVIFPGVFHTAREGETLTPPNNLWEIMDQKNNRVDAPGEKESFDRMEKSVDDLLKAVKRAKIGT